MNVDAREMEVAVNKTSKVRGQKFVVICSSVDAKKTEEQLKYAMPTYEAPKAPGMELFPVSAMFPLPRLRTQQAILQERVREVCALRHTGVTCRALKEGDPLKLKLLKGQLRE
ncbi:hypothetical protein EVAR_32427_1 [Eumeta japonica]|uniref:Uncharacterized protein n=1 Tax=Eumeta variegata TaxID=151549 RepID=A0A4C1VNZ3_EUMVA|nr:hypothetical protein EVAR_32427_1 [Eumeta japonica]